MSYFIGGFAVGFAVGTIACLLILEFLLRKFDKINPFASREKP